MVGLIIVSCNKQADIPAEQDVIFKASTATTGFKADDCDNEVAHYALIEIDGEMLTVDVFYLDGIIYTNTLKLSSGIHTISSFTLQNDAGTPADYSDDILVKATPLTGSDYAGFVQNSLPFNFDVDAFYKTEINIEILCYEAAEITDFGFAWFAVDQITVRELCFFGDICTEDYMDYTGTLYEDQRNGLQHDMPAIFKIDVYRNDDFVISYNNESYLGEGAVLCAQYPDFDNSTDEFKFELWVKVMVGSSFEYVLYHTFTTTDDSQLNSGADGVLDFVIGDCVPDADLIITTTPDPDPEPPVECGECDGKISQLTLRYVGSISNPHIKVTDDKDEIIYEGDPTDTFSFIGQKDKGDMGTKIFLYVNDGPKYEIHTSCSVDIYAGMTWGDYYIVSGESLNGGPLCTI